jgi:hypothetical protein
MHARFTRVTVHAAQSRPRAAFLLPALPDCYNERVNAAPPGPLENDMRRIA